MGVRRHRNVRLGGTGRGAAERADPPGRVESSVPAPSAQHRQGRSLPAFCGELHVSGGVVRYCVEHHD